MDTVYSAQYLTMKDSFSREGINIDVAYTPAGEARPRSRNRPAARRGPR